MSALRLATGVLSLAVLFSGCVAKQEAGKTVPPSAEHAQQPATPARAPEAVTATVHENDAPENLPAEVNEKSPEEMLRDIYNITEKAAGCKVPGIDDPKLSATLALLLFTPESPHMKDQLAGPGLYPLSEREFTFERAVDGDFLAFLQDNKITPLVQITEDRDLGAAFINAGAQKTLVIYVHKETDEQNSEGPALNPDSDDDFAAFLTKVRETGLATPGALLLYRNDFNIGQDASWEVHDFKPAEKSFEAVKGVPQTRINAPRNLCTPGTP